MNSKEKTTKNIDSINILEEYWFDYQYLKEKSQEIDRMTNLLNKSIERIEKIKKLDFPVDNIEFQKDTILTKLIEEEQELLKIMEKQKRVERLIENFPEPHKLILYLKYICFYTFDEIAVKLSYSTPRIYQIHKEAVIIFHEKY